MPKVDPSISTAKLIEDYDVDHVVLVTPKENIHGFVMRGVGVQFSHGLYQFADIDSGALSADLVAYCKCISKRGFETILIVCYNEDTTNPIERLLAEEYLRRSTPWLN